MKTSRQRCPRRLRIFPTNQIALVFAAALAIGSTNLGTAQTFSVLHTFTDTNEGWVPNGLLLSDNTLYGTTKYGPTPGYGRVFAVKTDGSGFRVICSLGASPNAGLVLFGNILYGTTWDGGASGRGTVFAVNTDGTGFRTLHSFSALDGNGQNLDGATPYGGLVLSGNALYGTTFYAGSGWGGDGGQGGTVFTINTDGTGFTVIHAFDPQMEGANSEAGLVVSGGILYGTTVADAGPPCSDPSQTPGGSIFAANADGTGFATIYYFCYGFCCPAIDGVRP